MGARVLALGVDQDNGLGLVFFQLGQARDQLVLRNVQGANDMAGGIILGRANIDDDGLILVDQRGQLRRAQAATTAAQFVSDQQRQRPATNCARPTSW